jgi:arabinogalactan oligomer/maltooligosaccharide transport system substrate-binding protein
LVLVLLVAACSAPATPTPTPAPSAPTNGLAGDLTIWQTYGSGAPGVTKGEPAAFSAAMDAVRAENPGLNLTVTEVGLGDLFFTYQLQAADGRPDLFIASNDITGDLERAGLLLDLGGRVDPAALSRFSELAVSGSTVGGKLIQMPESVRAVAVFYDTAKIGTFPATTDELLAAIQNGDFKIGVDQDIYHAFGFWGSFGGELMDDSGRCIADTTGVSDAFAYYRALKDAGALWFAPGEAAAAFNSGAIDAVIEAPRAGDAYRESHPTNLGVAPLPAGPDGPARPLTRVDGWAINPNSRNIDLAVAFARRVVEPDILRLFTDVAEHAPADPSVVSTDPVVAQYAAAVQAGLPRPQVPQLGAFWGPFGNALDLVLDEGADPAAAVAEACADMNRSNGL